MNRLPLPTGSAFQSPVSLSQVSQFPSPEKNPFTLGKHLEPYASVSDQSGISRSCLAPCSLFAPMHYESGYAYPLIVWLHGPGDNEDQLRTVLPLVSMRNHVAVAPQGTSEDESHGAFCWKQSYEDITEATQRTLDCIDIAQDRYHIHPERIFIAGYDCGGTMALRLAIENPELFAGAISLGGPLPRRLNLLRRVNEARHLPLLIANALEGQKYAPEQVCRDLRLLHAAGFSLDLRQYPCGDELTTKMLSDMDNWILKRICPSLVASSG